MRIIAGWMKAGSVLLLVAGHAFAGISGKLSSGVFRPVFLALNWLAVMVLSSVCALAGMIDVPAGGNFQTALNSAQSGDVITLAAGATFTGPFTLPCNSGSSYITIRTSAADSQLPPPGSRIDPTYVAVLPKLVAGVGAPVVSTQACSRHFQFLGIEIKPTAGTFLYALVELGNGLETSVSQLPSDFVFDRVYLHGDPTQGTRRGIAMNAPNVTVMNSYLSDFKEVGNDSQVLACWNGPGPLTITNNYLEGAGENILIGGADPRIPNLVATGITIRNNHFYKPWSWRGSTWTIKNLFELKSAKQVVVDGNLFENNWAAAQGGFAILFTVRNQDGTAPWSVVSDVQFTNNIVRHTASGVNILGYDDIYSSQQTHNILIKNNLFEDVNGAAYGGTGRLFQVLNGALNVTIDHNTGFSDGAVMMADQLPSSGLVFTNNIATHGTYGFSGSGTSEGIGTLNHYFPGAIFRAKALIGGNPSLYPVGNFFPSSISAVGFVDAGSGNYNLSASSPLHNAGTDGTDVGVNMAALNAAQSGGGRTIMVPPNLEINGGSVVNGASFRPANGPIPAIAPGTIISIFGTNLAGATQSAESAPVPKVLMDTVVSFNNVPAPLFYVSPTQINAQVPYGLPPGSVIVEVGLPSLSGVRQTITVATSAPGIFTLNQQGTGPGAILHGDDFRIVSETEPAHPGEYISIFSTGLGELSSPVDTGSAAPYPAPETILAPEVRVGNILANVSFSGLAPGFVGLYQVNVQVPLTAPAGNAVPLVLTSGGVPSNTVTIAIQ